MKVNSIKNLEELFDKEVREINEGFNRIESKIKVFNDFLNKKEKEFEFMELYEKALKSYPKIKKIKH